MGIWIVNLQGGQFSSNPHFNTKIWKRQFRFSFKLIHYKNKKSKNNFQRFWFDLILIFGVLTPFLTSTFGLFRGARFSWWMKKECTEKTTDLLENWQSWSIKIGVKCTHMSQVQTHNLSVHWLGITVEKS